LHNEVGTGRWPDHGGAIIRKQGFAMFASMPQSSASVDRKTDPSPRRPFMSARARSSFLVAIAFVTAIGLQFLPVVAKLAPADRSDTPWRIEESGTPAR
jgi:hypothetical protein